MILSILPSFLNLHKINKFHHNHVRNIPLGRYIKYSQVCYFRQHTKMQAQNNIVPLEEQDTCKVAKGASLVTPECRHNSTRSIVTETFKVIHSSLLRDSKLTTSRGRGIGCSTTSSEKISGLHFSEGTVRGVSEILDNAQSVIIWYSLLDKAALSSFIWRFSNKYFRNRNLS